MPFENCGLRNYKGLVACPLTAWCQIRCFLNGWRPGVDLKVHTPGGVVGQREALMDIVPDSERLLIDAQIDPHDIDMVRTGQAAEVRFTAFHQRELRPLKGRLISLSADRMVEERTGRAYYLGRIELTEDPGAVLKGAEVVPGMQADAIILTAVRLSEAADREDLRAGVAGRLIPGIPKAGLTDVLGSSGLGLTLTAWAGSDKGIEQVRA